MKKKQLKRIELKLNAVMDHLGLKDECDAIDLRTGGEIGDDDDEEGDAG